MSLNREKKSSFMICIKAQHNQHNGECMCIEEPQRLETPYLSLNDLCKCIMINVLFFTFIEKFVVAMHYYGYCALVCVAELLTGENQNSKICPTI